jgi:hypothetical protein
MLGSKVRAQPSARGRDLVGASHTSRSAVATPTPHQSPPYHADRHGRRGRVRGALGAKPPVGAVLAASRAAPRGWPRQLHGQIELVRNGIDNVADGASVALVSGITAFQPIRGGSVLAVINAGVDGFVRGDAVELSLGLRINAVSATVFAEAAASTTRTLRRRGGCP